MKKRINKLRSKQFHRDLNVAVKDLALGNVDEFRNFLENKAEHLTYRELITARNALIVRVRHKTDGLLRGDELKSHALELSSLFERLQDILDVKQHLELSRKEKANGKKPKLRLVRPIQEIEGNREKYTIRGVEIEIIVGKDRKGQYIVQIVNLKGGKLPGVGRGAIFSIDTLPPVLVQYFDPELSAQIKKTRDAKKIARIESRRAGKKNRGGGKKGKNDKRSKKAA